MTTATTSPIVDTSNPLDATTLSRACRAYARFYFKTFDFKNASREDCDIWKATQDIWIDDINDHDSSWHFVFEGVSLNPSQFVEYLNAKATNAKRSSYIKALKASVKCGLLC